MYFRFLFNHSEMSEQINQAKAQLEKLKEAEENLKEAEAKAKPIIQAIQQNMDASAKEMANRNAEHQKRKQELEMGKNLALKSLEEKYKKEIGQVEEKHHKEEAELEAKKWEENANFAKEMTGLKEQLKDKINWNQVDLVMGKKLVTPIANSKTNCWKSKNSISISTNGLKATSDAIGWRTVSAEKGFIISADLLGPIVHYFEVTKISSSYKWQILVGLSNGNIPNGSFVGDMPNSYGIQEGSGHCWVSGKFYPFEWPNGAIKPEWNGPGDVIGCGLVLNPKNELSIFLTVNGILMGKQIPINSTATVLYPTVSMKGDVWVEVEANFGDDSAKPFKYDIEKCPGLVVK